MKKFYLLLTTTVLCTCFLFSCKEPDPNRILVVESEENNGEDEGYDGPAQRDSLEFEKTKDPALGYVPTTRLETAIAYTENQKRSGANFRTLAPLTWMERGPIYDTVGPSNGNGRGGGIGVTGGYTSGRIRAVLIDTLNDPSGNTVFAGGVAGGLWRCTNFLDSIPNWQIINDNFENMALSSICQDPNRPTIMYFATGEATSNADAVFGKGVWKSTNAGLSWTFLPSTVRYLRNFKIVCDTAGNVYLATRTLTIPVEQPYGLLRSKDGGATWVNITPAGLNSNATCTDIEISSTGTLHAAFGYLGTIVNHRYTSTPASVTSGGWNSSAGIRSIANPPGASRMELATLADTLYAVTVSSATSNIDSGYKSIDGGVTWTKQNPTVYPNGLTNGQGWYNVTLAINPSNSSEIMIGGLDAYRSVNSGQTVTRRTVWAGTGPYVHADHHFMQWWNVGGESRILIGCDGGLFLSRNGGTTWRDKNRNLSIKQFYDAAIHPDAGSDYLLAGAQDNGTHQLKYSGKGPSIEVTGGDGAFVHINKKNPQIQFGSYIRNQYRRSVNGGQTWQAINYSETAGLFINPYDYDDDKNIMYAAWSAGTIFRWKNADTSFNADLVSITGLGTGTASSFKVSPNTPGRLFIGSNTGRLYRLDRADTVSGSPSATSVTDIRSASFPTGFINCVNVGSTDSFMVAVFTNYGVNNIWYSNNAGASWSAVDGNLPDMPVRWAIFHPQYNNRLVIATEAGVYTTDAVNGANTVWVANTSFPTVRTDALEMRTSDYTVVAATHGRGLYTAVIPVVTAPEINFSTNATTVTEDSAGSIDCRRYKDYAVDLEILNAPGSNANLKMSVQGGTAKRGVDFDFTTNGDFTNASDQLVFAAGSKDKKSITIRIYDDAEVEQAESFTIDFTLSGSGNATKGSLSSHIITITDNDRTPTESIVRNHSIGNYNSEIIATSPFAGNRIKHRTQHLFTAAELRAAGVYKSASISSLTVRVVTKNSTKPFTGLTISMANATATSLTNFTNSTLTQVYSNDYTMVEGNNTFNFSTPFTWDGTSNVVVQFCFDNSSSAGAVDIYPDFLEGNSYPFGAGVRASVYANYTTGAVSGCSLPAALIADARINATFGVNFGESSIASLLNTSRTEYLTSSNDLYYYSTTGEVIARVRNLSEHNYGCTNVLIDRGGTGATQFWNNNKNNYLMDKTFQLIPATNNATGKYEVTLYYTKAEKEGWEAATGRSWNEIQLVKLPSRIANVTPTNAQPDGPGTVQVVTPVRGTFGTGYTLTYTFENGFGGIGAGVAGRMNTVITLTGKVEGNQIALQWTTSAEINSTVFEIEKSYDSINFRKIGSMQATGNKLSPTTYSFIDKENVEINYYRVRLLHSDSYVALSNTLFIRNENAPQQMFVLTNPFSYEIRVRFGRVPRGPLVFSLYDAGGKQVQRYQSPAGSNNLVFFNINSANVVSRAIYILDVYVDGKHYKAKLMRQ